MFACFSNWSSQFPQLGFSKGHKKCARHLGKQAGETGMTKILGLSTNRWLRGLIAVFCLVVFISLFVPQTCLGQTGNLTAVQDNDKATDVEVLQVIPLIWLLLPVAAVAAYFLERASTKMAPSKSTWYPKRILFSTF